jgi:hypothetical protein
MNRKFYGNQYIGKTWHYIKRGWHYGTLPFVIAWRITYLLAQGTAIAVQGIIENPKWIGFGVATLALAINLFTALAPSHPVTLLVQDAWADLTTDETYVNLNTIVIHEKDPVKVLEVLAQCESGGKHFDEKGRAVINFNNKNGTIDIGKYQVNSAHQRNAYAKGWDIYTEEGNREMALYLYENEGLKPWNSSRHCWNNKI